MNGICVAPFIKMFRVRMPIKENISMVTIMWSKENSYILLRKHISIKPLWRKVQKFLKKLKTYLPYDLGNLLLGM